MILTTQHKYGLAGVVSLFSLFLTAVDTRCALQLSIIMYLALLLMATWGWKNLVKSGAFGYLALHVGVLIWYLFPAIAILFNSEGNTISAVERHFTMQEFSKTLRMVFLFSMFSTITYVCVGFLKKETILSKDNSGSEQPIDFKSRNLNRIIVISVVGLSISLIPYLLSGLSTAAIFAAIIAERTSDLKVWSIGGNIGGVESLRVVLSRYLSISSFCVLSCILLDRRAEILGNVRKLLFVLLLIVGFVILADTGTRSLLLLFVGPVIMLYGIKNEQVLSNRNLWLVTIVLLLSLIHI